MEEIRNEQEPRQFRVLITNFHSTKNAGDLALLIATRDLLNEVFHNPVITVSANWPNESNYKNYDFSVAPSLRSMIQSESSTKPFQQAWRLFQLLFWLHPRIINKKRSPSCGNKE